MLRACRDARRRDGARRGAAAASERAQGVDYGLRIAAQEQVGLAYAGWDRLLTRVALPAWRIGRWPSRLDAGVVSALTELSRRDRLAEGFASRLGERPACDLLEEPGAVDRAVSLLAARLFHGGPAEPGPDWSPVELAGVSGGGRGPELAHPRRPASSRPRRLWRPPSRAAPPRRGALRTQAAPPGRHATRPGRARRSAARTGQRPTARGPTLARVIDRLARDDGGELSPPGWAPRSTAQREEAARPAAAAAASGRRPRRRPGATAGRRRPWCCRCSRRARGRELLADHVTAMVCCAAVDTAGAAPGWTGWTARRCWSAARAGPTWPARCSSLVDTGTPGRCAAGWRRSASAPRSRSGWCDPARLPAAPP